MATRWYRNAGLQVALGFVLLMLALSVWSAFVPTFEQRCMAACRAEAKVGRLVPISNPIQTRRPDVPSECKCVSQGY